MHRLFRGDGKVFIVAMDHGAYGIVDGLENMGETINLVSKAGADAVMMNVGILKNYVSEIAGRVALVATTEYDENSVMEALKADAVAVKTTYLGVVPPDDALKEKIKRVALKCGELGIPYMAEYLPMDPDGNPAFEPDIVKKAARILAELGADIVKTVYTGSRETFRRVVEACPVPIVIAGGPKIGDDESLIRMVRESIDSGAKGVAIGRNIWQHRAAKKIVAAIKGLVHEDMDVKEALETIK
ncbi:MAG: fructose-bisphosphate aldolase [Candidatus Bathyarchaeia archaeon]|nr:fructose-bisphosphate aldolase [Candidatus Bathyarchaeota archaeon]